MDREAEESVSHKNERAPDLVMDPRKLDDVEKDKLTDWAVEPSIIELKEDLEYARQENTDQVTNVNGWLDLRNATGAESGNKTVGSGRSKIQPKLIRKHNEWRYPGLTEPFLNTDRMFEIKPRTHEDKESARQNQIVLNYQFDTKLNKVDLIDRYVRRVVDEGTCVIRVGWKRETEKVLCERNVYDYIPIDEMVDEEAIEMLTQATELYMNEDPQYELLPEDLQAAVEYSAENQTPVTAKKSGTEKYYDTKITANHPEIDFVNIKNFFIDPSCDGIWEKAQYKIFTHETTKSALKKRKIYKNLNDVDWLANSITANVGNQDHTSNSPQIDSRTNVDKVKVLVYEYWGLYDIHNNGVMVPIRAAWIGDTFILMDENPFPDRKAPFVIVPYMPILDSSFGETDASLLQDNQRIAGAVTRGMIDLMARSANAQTAFAKGFLDATNRKRASQGQDFEYTPNISPEMGMHQMKYPEIPQSAHNMLAQQNAEGEALTGVKSFSSGITGEAYGKVARGITGAMDAAALREISILRRLVEGMKLVAEKIIAMNAIYLKEVEIIRITNEEFVTIKRKDLAGNFDIKCDISTQTTDEAKSQDLVMMLQTNGPDMNPSLSQKILAKIADLKRMPDLAQEIREYQPKPDPVQEKLKQLEIEKLMSEIELNKARASQANAQANNTELETELEGMGIKHDRAVEAQGAQARGNRSLEVSKALLAGQVGAGNIEAAVGFNKLTELEESRDTNLPIPPQDPLVNQEPLGY